MKLLKKWCVITLAILPGCLWLGEIAAHGKDLLWLHDNSKLEGSVLREHRGAYWFRDVQGQMRKVPKTSVRLVVYGDERQASEILQLERAKRLTGSDSTSLVQVLPTPAFGRSVLQGVNQARQSIHICAYILSGAMMPPVSEFYAVLRQKAAEGVNVLVITEFGPGTSDHIKNEVFDFAMQLESSGIDVRFIQERRVMHKKLVLVDDQELWIGSANLTLAGMVTSDEMNLHTRDEQVVADAKADIARLKERSLLSNEVRVGARQ